MAFPGRESHQSAEVVATQRCAFEDIGAGPPVVGTVRISKREDRGSACRGPTVNSDSTCARADLGKRSGRTFATKRLPCASVNRLRVESEPSATDVKGRVVGCQ